MHGLELPLIDGKWPRRFDCGSNNLKAENVEWARRAIQELAKHGAVSTWAEHVANGFDTGGAPAHEIMSLLVTPKSGKPGKFRLIHDCRPLNELLEKWAFKMEHLADFVKELSELDPLFSLDIQSAYHHVEIMPRFRTLLGVHVRRCRLRVQLPPRRPRHLSLRVLQVHSGNSPSPMPQ
jgi:hypothetical protein